MKNKKQIFSTVLTVVISVFLVSMVVYGATTIGTNIQTDGTASSTSATTTDYLYVGPDGTEDNFDFSGGDIYVADDAEIDGALYVTGASTFTGLATFGRATSTSATSTDYIYIGPDGSEGTFDFSGGDLYVADDAEIDSDLVVANKATTTVAHAVGSGTIDNLDMAGGDLYVQDDAEIDGSLWVDSATTTDSLAIGGYTSSTGAINTQGALHAGGNFDVDGTAIIGAAGSTITQVTFGTCNIATASITASTTAFTECTSATGVASGDNVFVTATSSLPTNFIVQAASSTSANEISIRIFNTGSIEGTDTGVRTFFWQAVQ